MRKSKLIPVIISIVTLSAAIAPKYTNNDVVVTQEVVTNNASSVSDGAILDADAKIASVPLDVITNVIGMNSDEEVLISIYSNYEEVRCINTSVDNSNVAFSEWYDYKEKKLHVTLEVSAIEGTLDESFVRSLMNVYVGGSDWLTFECSVPVRQEFKNGEITSIVSSDSTRINIGITVDKCQINEFKNNVRYVMCEVL